MAGGFWLGYKFDKSIGRKPFAVETIKQGILKHVEVWRTYAEEPEEHA